ncbi:MBL fold metallo-hydrolase [Halomonas stenophila]|uniref:Glyoxylase-like metal-dependent hydrolase (Beta-lactamase superfamily II) n=1 Tax=Halomonas stenophila TaxID=795312 RepID=A0A7W5EQV2_9GAMM|nr:glyoxylase-like metal-dependent hydrolase (beta-lactamase superfamily II) [Halomonas stenophila]
MVPPYGLEGHRVRFPVDDVLALVVSHVHIDHIGRLPYLLAAGYRGPILCSVPSARHARRFCRRHARRGGPTCWCWRAPMATAATRIAASAGHALEVMLATETH